MTKYLWLPPTADSWENHLLNGFDVTGISWCGQKIKADKYLSAVNERYRSVHCCWDPLLTSKQQKRSPDHATYLRRAAPPAYCLFKSGLISPKLRHIVNMAPSPPATLRFHRKIGHCQIELQILADSHIQFCFKQHIATKLHLLKVGFGNTSIQSEWIYS